MPILNWLGRDEALKTAVKTPYRLLEEVPELGYGDKNTENMIVQGDNLEALKALLPFYAGQVKCIYIDPPYNTGTMQNILYNDNVEHSQWLSIIYPRLEMLREFLREDGCIFISIDNKEYAYLKIICDEVFGRNNFRANIVWKKVSSAKSQSNFLGNVVEYILFYSKSDLCNFYPQYIKGDEDKDAKNYPYIEENTGRRYGSFDFTQKGQGEAKTFWGKLINPPKGKHWIWTQDKIDEGIENNIIFMTKSGLPRLKRYLDVKKGNYISDLWNDEDVAPISANSKEAMDFFGQKSEALIKRILELSTKPNDIVLDSFLGSGTTAAVAHKMGRRYIGIEMGNHAVTHCVPRLKAVVGGEQGGISKAINWQGGGGFRFYRLGNEIFDADGNINENISFENLSAHIWFTETKTPFNKPETKSTYLGTYDNVSYALLYNGILRDRRVDGGNVLTNKTLNVILDDMKHQPYEKLVIYGESSRISQARLKSLNIEFKQTPYDIKAR